MDEGDESIVHTAVRLPLHHSLPPFSNQPPFNPYTYSTQFREAHEEVSLPLSSPSIHTLSILSPFLSQGQLLVTPIVAFLTDPSLLATLVPAPGEVDHIFTHPLEAILEPELARKEPLVDKGGKDWPYKEEFHVSAGRVCGVR